MTTFGVTSVGLVKKTQAIIVDEIADLIKDGAGDPLLNFLAEAGMGNIANAVSKGMADIWDALQAVYANGDPSG